MAAQEVHLPPPQERGQEGAEAAQEPGQEGDEAAQGQAGGSGPWVPRWCDRKKSFLLVQVEAEKEKGHDVWPKMKRLADTASTIAELTCIKSGERTGLEVVAVELDWGK